MSKAWGGRKERLSATVRVPDVPVQANRFARTRGNSAG